jgi:hypothetical protein
LHQSRSLHVQEPPHLWPRLFVAINALSPSLSVARCTESPYLNNEAPARMPETTAKR